MPMDVNSDYTLFGGRLMEWIDVVAGIVARRHSGRQVRTAAVDKLTFLAPAYVDDVVAIEGRLIHTGRSSMIVCVDTYVERHPNHVEKMLVNEAFLTMVAVDENGKSVPVPMLIAESEEDEKDMALGRARRAMRETDK